MGSILWVMTCLIYGSVLLPTVSTGQQPPVTIDGSLQGLTGSGNNAGLRKLSGQDIAIDAEMGLTRGSNLFHSFGRFNVPDSGSVTFSGPSSIENILSRVTGNDPSNINGVLASTIDDANLYLMNPNGIIFGKNASLNVKGSFYATTANSIEFEELIEGQAPGVFHANKNTGDILTTAAPEAFGFLGSVSPAPITIEASTYTSPTLEVPVGEMLSFVGGNLTVSNKELRAPSGVIILTSLNSSKTDQQVRTTGETNPNTNMGTVTINEFSSFSTGSDSPGPGGPIVIRAGQLKATGTLMNSSNADSPDKAGAITLIATDTASITDSTIVVSSKNAGGTGMVTITAGETLTFTNSLILSESDKTSNDGGTVRLEASSLNVLGAQLGNLDTISTSVSGENTFIRGGSIELEGNKVTVEAGAGITSLSLNKAQAGNVTIIGKESVTISGANAPNGRSVIATNTLGEGNGGTISVRTKQLLLSDGGRIESTTSSQGDAGRIEIIATERMIVSGRGQEVLGGALPSELTTQATEQGSGNAGTIDISTGKLSMNLGSRIQSNTGGSSEAGTITISAASIEISGQDTHVSSDTIGSGQGGTIRIRATDGNVEITDYAKISATSTGKGDAGIIQIEANDSILIENSLVTTQAALGSGGEIKLDANTMIHFINSTIESSVKGNPNTFGGDISLDPQFVVLQNSRILATATSGFGGNIEIIGDIVLADPFSLDPKNLSATSARGPQFSGKVDIRAPIQNLSETIAPLSESIAKVATMFAARCASRKDGQYSSFVQGRRNQINPIFGRFSSSPMILQNIIPPHTTAPSHKAGLNKSDRHYVSMMNSKELAHGC